MQLKSKIKHIVQYWLLLEKLRQEHEELETDLTAARRRFAVDLRVPSDSPQRTFGT